MGGVKGSARSRVICIPPGFPDLAHRSAAVASLMLTHTRLSPASEALHWLFPWPGMLFPTYLHGSIPHLKHHPRTLYLQSQTTFGNNYLFPLLSLTSAFLTSQSNKQFSYFIYFLSISCNYKVSAVKVGDLGAYLPTYPQGLNYYYYENNPWGMHVLN